MSENLIDLCLYLLLIIAGAWSMGFHRLEDLKQISFLARKLPSTHMGHVGPLPFVASEGCQLSLHRARLHPSNASQARTSRCLQQFAAVLLPYAGWLVLESLQ